MGYMNNYRITPRHDLEAHGGGNLGDPGLGIRAGFGAEHALAEALFR